MPLEKTYLLFKVNDANICGLFLFLSFSLSLTFARQQIFAEMALSYWRLGKRTEDFLFANSTTSQAIKKNLTLLMLVSVYG